MSIPVWIAIRYISAELEIESVPSPTEEWSYCIIVFHEKLSVCLLFNCPSVSLSDDYLMKIYHLILFFCLFIILSLFICLSVCRFFQVIFHLTLSTV